MRHLPFSGNPYALTPMAFSTTFATFGIVGLLTLAGAALDGVSDRR